MAYKVLYLEDLRPDTIQREIEAEGIEVTHICPEDNFEETLNQIKLVEADLLLMDFRLNAGQAKFNAPPFAQFFRSQVIDGGNNLPIVVISSENNIRDYYRDYTSFDLFDFAVDKETFLRKSKKYCSLFKELIDGYNLLIGKETSYERLLDIPESVGYRLDSRFLDLLSMEKYQTNACMMTGLLLSTLIKPIGILIGPDVLSARLGVALNSPDWEHLLSKLEEFKYTGLYGQTYDRWWAQGLDIWWKSNFSSSPTLRRLTIAERCKLIEEKFGFEQLTPIVMPEHSRSQRPWTICSGSFSAIDPIDGYELTEDINNSPWIEPKYYSLDFLINYANTENINQLKEMEKHRFSSLRRNS